MAMVSALRGRAPLPTRNRVSLLAKTYRKRDVNSIVSPGQQFHAFRSYPSVYSSLKQSMGVYRPLFPSDGLLTSPSKFISRSFNIDPLSITAAGLKYLDWARDRAESHVKLLSSKPTHAYQPRTDLVNTISEKIKRLQKQFTEDMVLTVYIKGKQGIGKTQLARELGEKFYEQWQSGKKIVATMDTKSKARFLRCYLRLGLELKCPLNTTQLQDIATEVQVKLQHLPNWLLIVEELTQERNDLYKQFLPQPGSQQWGRGVVLVTTSDDRVIPHDNRCTDTLEMPPMTEGDSIELLQNISGSSREKAKEIVNNKPIERIPIAVASAGIYMNSTKDFSLKDFPLQVVPKDQDITDDVDTIAQTAEQLAQSDATLDKVFRLLAFCPHEPLPMSVIERYLGEHTDLDTVRKCGLLGRNSLDNPEDEYDEIERVYLLPATYKSFVNTFAKIDSSSEQMKLVEKIVHCILQEYKEACHSHSTASEWKKQMLFPHIRKFWEICTELPRYQRLQLCVALSNSYLDISNEPKKAESVLQQLIADFKDKWNLTLRDLEPLERAKICLALGTTYRHLGDYQKSTQYLNEALDEKKHLEDLDVADILREFGATVFSYGEYMKSREHLQDALDLYKVALGPNHPLVVETLSSLAYLCIKEGRWKKGETYLKETEGLMGELHCNKHLALMTQDNLNTLKSELGGHDKAIDTLNTEVQKWTGTPYHVAPAMPLAKLTAAYYRNGDWSKSEETFQKLESTMKEQVDIPLAAFQALGTTICDFGDIQMAKQLCRMMENVKAEDAQLLLGKLHRLIGDWNKAQQILEAALKRSEAVCGPNHIRVGKLLGDLGKVYQDQGLLTRSVATLERAHDIHRNFYGSHSHPEVAFVLGDLGRAVQRTGDEEHGTSMMKEALGIWNRSTNNPGVFTSKKTNVHAMYSQVLSNYGILLRDTGKFDKAEQKLMNALELQDQILTYNSLPRLKTIYRLGTVWDRQGKPEEAKEKIESALNSLREISPDHPYAAVMLTGTARCIESNPEAALQYLEQALDIRTKPEARCVDIHALTARCYRVRGEILQTQDPPGALESFMQANEVLAQLIARERTEQSHMSSDSSIEVAVVKKWELRQKSNRKKLNRIIADMRK